MTYILDAGPCLNFLATNNERVLLSVVGRELKAPETVRDEVVGKSTRDDPTPTLIAAADSVLTGQSMTDLPHRKKDLGEHMVVIHAVAAAMTGQSVIVIIDDGYGRHIAGAQIRRLDRLTAIQDHRTSPPIGSVSLWSTTTVLKAAARCGQISNKPHMRRIYEQLRACDDGLVRIEQTDLLDKALWEHL